MFERRCYVSACRLDARHVLAAGGYNNRFRVHSTEVLDTERNVWARGGRMTVIR